MHNLENLFPKRVESWAGRRNCSVNVHNMIVLFHNTSTGVRIKYTVTNASTNLLDVSKVVSLWASLPEGGMTHIMGSLEGNDIIDSICRLFAILPGAPIGVQRKHIDWGSLALYPTNLRQYILQSTSETPPWQLNQTVSWRFASDIIHQQPMQPLAWQELIVSLSKLSVYCACHLDLIRPLIIALNALLVPGVVGLDMLHFTQSGRTRPT
jgi:hypothetical protein